MYSSDTSKISSYGAFPRSPSFSGARTKHTYVATGGETFIEFTKFSPVIGKIDINANEIDVIKKTLTSSNQLVEIKIENGLSLPGDYYVTATGISLYAALSAGDVIQVTRQGIFLSQKSVPYEIPRYKWVIPNPNFINLTTGGSGTHTINGTLTFTSGDVNTTDDTITKNAHGLTNSQSLIFTTTDTLPSGLTTTLTYYAFIVDINTIKVCTGQFIQDTFRVPFLIPKTKTTEIPAYWLFLDGKKITLNTGNDTLNTDKIGDFYEIDFIGNYVRDFKLNVPFENFDVTPKTFELYMNGFVDYTDTFVTKLWEMYQGAIGFEYDNGTAGVTQTFDLSTTPSHKIAMNLNSTFTLLNPLKGRLYVIRVVQDHIYFTGTVSIATPAVWNSTAHGLNNNDPVTFTTTGALPTGIVVDKIYYVKNKTLNTFEISETVGGSSVNTTGSQSGVHTIHSGGFRQITWPITVKWPYAIVPEPSGSNRVDLYSLYYDGTYFYGSTIQGYING